jgi:hypothetical protein
MPLPEPEPPLVPEPSSHPVEASARMIIIPIMDRSGPTNEITESFCLEAILARREGYLA